MTALDPRLNVFRADLADARLRGKVDATRFVAGALRRMRAPSAFFHQAPSPDAPIVSEAIQGELVRVFEEQEGWAWVQLETDSYVGWMSGEALGPIDPAPTHRVTALRAFVFPQPDLKLPPRTALPFGSLLTLNEEIITRGTSYRLLANGGGAIPSVQVAPLDAPPALDYVAVAEKFLGVPYLWGGRTSLGLDCSALVQTALAAAGIAVPRDTDIQERAIGHAVESNGPRMRGDLVFWKGHVGIVSAPDRLLHANAHHMAVAEELLAGALERIGPPTNIRRL